MIFDPTQVADFTTSIIAVVGVFLLVIFIGQVFK